MEVEVHLLRYGGVSSTQLSFKPRNLRGVQKSLKLIPSKKYPKILTYFFVLADVTRDRYDLLRSLMCIDKTFTMSYGRIFL